MIDLCFAGVTLPALWKRDSTDLVSGRRLGQRSNDEELTSCFDLWLHDSIRCMLKMMMAYGVEHSGANRLTWRLCRSLCSRDGWNFWFLGVSETSKLSTGVWGVGRGAGAGLEMSSRPANGWQRQLGDSDAQDCGKSVLCGHFIFYTWMFIRFPVARSKTLETAQRQLRCVREARKRVHTRLISWIRRRLIFSDWRLPRMSKGRSWDEAGNKLKVVASAFFATAAHRTPSHFYKPGCREAPLPSSRVARVPPPGHRTPSRPTRTCSGAILPATARRLLSCQTCLHFDTGSEPFLNENRDCGDRRLF